MVEWKEPRPFKAHRFAKVLREVAKEEGMAVSVEVTDGEIYLRERY